jgi:hypothetical protein
VQGNLKVTDVRFERHLTKQPVYVAQAKGVPFISIYEVTHEATPVITGEAPSSSSDERGNLDAPDLE